MLPVSLEAAEVLFRVVDAAYERRSLAITSNLHPSAPETRFASAPLPCEEQPNLA